nr:MAG TPA: hypothetical protein [Caudoviricetes sp.]
MKKCRRCRALACSLKDKAREGRAMKSMTYGEARQIARDLARIHWRTTGPAHTRWIR